MRKMTGWRHSTDHLIRRSPRGEYCFTCRAWVRVEVWRCQFCVSDSDAPDWKRDRCPKCNRKYDYALAQDSEE
jgi:hypothetical protein